MDLVMEKASPNTAVDSSATKSSADCDITPDPGEVA